MLDILNVINKYSNFILASVLLILFFISYILKFLQLRLYFLELIKTTNIKNIITALPVVKKLPDDLKGKNSNKVIKKKVKK